MTEPVLDKVAKRYVETKFEQTRQYLQEELRVLESVYDWDVEHRLLDQLPERIRLVVDNKIKVPDSVLQEQRERLLQARKVYLKMVSDELERMAVYTSMDGPFWGEVNIKLRGLSAELKLSGAIYSRMRE